MQEDLKEEIAAKDALSGEALKEIYFLERAVELKEREYRDKEDDFKELKLQVNN